MTDEPRLSRVYLDLVDREAERLLAMQGENGAFLTDGVAMSYEQNALYPLALSFSRADGRYHEDARLLDAIGRAGDFHAREMDTEGQWEIVTPGGRWGSYLDEWRLYFWLETLLLLEDRLDAEQRARWDAAIARSAAAIASNLQENDARGAIDFVEGDGFSSPNHMAWHFLVCRRAGVRYGRAEWVALADRLFEQMRAGQTSDGFWLERAAPAVGYNAISLLAVGLYGEHRWPDTPVEWVEAVERGMKAQIDWTYPGGGPIAEVDGRQRYHGPLGHALPALCAHWMSGAASLRQTARFLSARTTVRNFDLPFLSETARYLSRHEAKDDRAGMGDEPLLLSLEHKARDFEGGWRRRGDWQAVLGGVVTSRYESRWRLDIANRIGLYHTGLGLLAGGGQSKDDPDWATFTVRRPGGGDPAWLPTAATVTLSEPEDRLVLCYGEDVLEASVVLRPDSATVRYAILEAVAGTRVTARLLRPLPPGTEVVMPDGDTTMLDIESPVSLQLEAGGEVRIGGGVYSLPPAAAFNWPLLPFNPYDQDNASPPDAAFAAFAVELTSARVQAVFILRRAS